MQHDSQISLFINVLSNTGSLTVDLTQYQSACCNWVFSSETREHDKALSVRLFF